MDASEIGAALAPGVAVGVGALPDDFVAEVGLPEELVEHELQRVHLLRVEVQVQRAPVGQHLMDEDEPLAQELDELGALDLVGVRELALARAELPTRRERRVHVAEPEAIAAVGVLQLAATLHLQQRLQDLEVVALDDEVRPIAVVGRPETLERLERHGHRLSEDDPRRRLARVGDADLLGLREEPRAVVVVEVFAGFQPGRNRRDFVRCELWPTPFRCHREAAYESENPARTNPVARAARRLGPSGRCAVPSDAGVTLDGCGSLVDTAYPVFP